MCCLLFANEKAEKSEYLSLWQEKSLLSFCNPMFQMRNYFHVGLPLPPQHHKMSFPAGEAIGGQEESCIFAATLGKRKKCCQFQNYNSGKVLLWIGSFHFCLLLSFLLSKWQQETVKQKKKRGGKGLSSLTLGWNKKRKTPICYTAFPRLKRGPILNALLSGYNPILYTLSWK